MGEVCCHFQKNYDARRLAGTITLRFMLHAMFGWCRTVAKRTDAVPPWTAAAWAIAAWAIAAWAIAARTAWRTIAT
jgi:hypothetical protein